MGERKIEFTIRSEFIRKGTLTSKRGFLVVPMKDTFTYA